MSSKIALGALAFAALAASSWAAPAQAGILDNDFLLCDIPAGRKTISIKFNFHFPERGFRPNFQPTVDDVTPENSGDILTQRVEGNRRIFTVRFKSGWEATFTATSDGRLVSDLPRRGSQTGSAQIEGKCHGA